MVTVNYVNGFCKGVDLEDLRSLKKVGNSIHYCPVKAD